MADKNTILVKKILRCSSLNNCINNDFQTEKFDKTLTVLAGSYTK